MTDTTATRDHKPAGDLTPGDYVWHHGFVTEVRHVEPYTHDSKPWALVVMAGGTSYDSPANTATGLATADEIAEAEAVVQRAAVANALRDLAAAIVNNALPVPHYTLRITAALQSRADVDRWAEHLDVKIRMGGHNADIPVAERELPVANLSLDIHFQGPSETRVAGAL